MKITCGLYDNSVTLFIICHIKHKHLYDKLNALNLFIKIGPILGQDKIMSN